MPRLKHTRCSLCQSLGHYGFLELMWRNRSDGPWHYVGGYACAACRSSLLDFIGQLGSDLVAWDG